MQTMYPGQPNSPRTTLAQAIDATQTTIEVTDGMKLPDAPNIAVIGTDENAETILYESKEGNILSNVTRAFQGTARSWPAGSPIARNFTAYDYDALRQNLSAHLAERATLDQYGHIQHGVIKTTIPSSGWTGTEAPYTNVVTIPEILDTDSPIIDVIAEDESVQEAWGLINRAITDTGLITFYASDVPTIDIPIQIKVVR